MNRISQRDDPPELKHEVGEHFASAAEFYGELYQGTTALAHLFATRLKRVRELIDNVEGISVLDIGCGPGIIAAYLIERNSKYFGLDLTIEMLVDHQARIDSSDSDYLAVGDMENLPYHESSFDVVLCLGALEYLDNVSQAIQEMSRVMKENGSIIISMQNRWSLYRFWDRHFYHGRIFNLLRKLLGREISSPLLEKSYSRQYFCELLADNQLTVVDVVYYDFNLWLSPLDKYFPQLCVFTSRKLEALRRTPLKDLGTGFIIKARKGKHPR